MLYHHAWTFKGTERESHGFPQGSPPALLDLQCGKALKFLFHRPQSIHT